MSTEIVDRRTLYEGRIVQLEVLEIEDEAQQRQRREVVRHAPVVAVVALKEAEPGAGQGLQLLVVRQYRVAVEASLTELVAGFVDEGESPLAAAQRELREESGFEAKAWHELGTIYSSPGFTDEAVTLFLARDLTFVGAAPDEGEQLSIHWLPFTLALEQVLHGELGDAKSVAGILWAAHWLQAAG